MFKDYASIRVGDSAKLVREIGEEDIKRFVEMTGDDNPLHVNRAYAETTPFKDIVVHGMLGASFISTVIGTQLPGEGALWVSQTLDFLLPVRLGDTLTISGTVLSKNDRERLLELETTVVNQTGQLVLTGKGKVKVLEVTPKAAAGAAPERRKVAIVTGGAGGIGRAICLKLAQAGYSVAVNYATSENRAAEVVKSIQAAGCKALAVRADVTDTKQTEELVAKTARAFGDVSLVVHNASSKIASKTFELLEWGDLQRHLDVQLRGMFSLAKACVPAMKAQRYGKLVAITSQVLDGSPTPGWTSYAVGKSALATFCRYLAQECGPHGIAVNCVSPGMTDTGFIGDIPEKARLIVARQTPLRRLATPEDVAAAVGFLASDGADFITGETLRVNGGQVML